MHRVMIVCRAALLFCAAAPFSMAQEPIAARSASEPDPAKIYKAMDASMKASPPDLLTTGEKTGFNQTAPYAEAVELAHRLEKASPYVKVLNFGTSPEGRGMIAVVASKDRAFTPEAAAGTGKAVILIQSGIHSGEIEGKDTSLMLLRDACVTALHADWLDKMILVVIPVFNVDGHDRFSKYHRPSQNGPYLTGTRSTAQGINLNRDYIKADAPEMRAWLRLFNEWLPDFMFDNHVTDGSDVQYDVTWDIARNQDLAEPARAWVDAQYLPELDQRMGEDGHLAAPYGGLRSVPDGKREFFIEVFSPRYSHLYSAAQNRPCLLIETHSLKKAKTRASANYDIMRNTLDIIAANPDALRQAVREADSRMAARAGDPSAAPVYLGGTVDRQKSRPFLYRALKRGEYRSEVSGNMVTRYLPDHDDIETVIHDQVVTTVEARMPLGYLIPVAWKPLADVLRLHGVEMETIAKPVTREFGTYRFANVSFADSQFEGRVMVNFEVQPVKEKVTVPAGSFWVPMNQRRAPLILQMLEPAAPDSLAHWGFIDTVVSSRRRRSGPSGPGEGDQEGAYITEPIARRMMANSPELQKEFAAKLAADAGFAADPQARLQWWYERSNYAPEEQGRYPVVLVWEKDW